MSSRATNIVDLRSYRERRKALDLEQELADAPIAVQHPVQPFPFYASAFFFGFWPCWVMSPIPMIMAGLSGAATDD